MRNVVQEIPTDTQNAPMRGYLQPMKFEMIFYGKNDIFIGKK